VIGAFGLLVLGIALIVAEVFLVSFGALAVAAGTCIILADVIAFGEGEAWGWGFVAAEIVLIPWVLWTAFRVLPRTRFGRRIVLEGPATAPKPGVPAFEHLLGKRGSALTDLRPAGTAEFGEERLSVVSLGGLVERGAAVVVASVEGTEVRVRRAPSPEPSAPAASPSSPPHPSPA
jgi:membrane-bound serine protease (ClpP class)